MSPLCSNSSGLPPFRRTHCARSCGR
ncbi:MAG: hypothetical protein KGS60_01190 [Verrucomicrobia bacterium]|nr:hypothetical protein [Verrucomicrobiota bacterium]